MTRIYQTLSDPTVPRGGTIRDAVGWESQVPTGETFNFRVFALYGTNVDGTLQNFFSAFGGAMDTGSIGSMSRVDNIDTPITADVPLGNYDCLTIVGYQTPEEIIAFDWKIDLGVLTVELPLGATIISTTFSSI